MAEIERLKRLVLVLLVAHGQNGREKGKPTLTSGTVVC
jgi:hypothetical protein